MSRAAQVVRLYTEARAHDQLRSYAGRAAELETAGRQLTLASAIVGGAVAAIAVVSGLDLPGKPVGAVLAAVLPAIATALSAYGGLYGFDRTAKLYRDAARNIPLVPEPPPAELDDDRAADYVAVVERALANERAQWGQLVAEVATERCER